MAIKIIVLWLSVITSYDGFYIDTGKQSIHVNNHLPKSLKEFTNYLRVEEHFKTLIFIFVNTIKNHHYV